MLRAVGRRQIWALGHVPHRLPNLRANYRWRPLVDETRFEFIDVSKYCVVCEIS